jgi:glycosyltransferase involved in cell wall biosynthesis
LTTPSQRNHPLVSCVVTSFNQAEFIRVALDSVVGQTYANTEILVVDDESTDGTPAILRQYQEGSGIRLVEGLHSGLPAVARNRGLDQATGEFVAFLDGDDAWLPEKIERQVAAFEDGVVGVGSNVALIGEHGRYVQRRLIDVDLSPDELALGNTVALSTLMVRNDGTRFDPRPIFRFVEDFDFQIRASLRSGGVIRRLGDTLAQYRIHPSGGSREVERMAATFEVLRAYRELLPSEILRKAAGQHYLRMGLRALKSDQPSRAYFKEASRRLDGPIALGAAILTLAALIPRPLKEALLNAYYGLRRKLDQIDRPGPAGVTFIAEATHRCLTDRADSDLRPRRRPAGPRDA